MRLRSKPKRLFRARMRGRALYVGPEFAGGQEPNYLALLDEITRRYGDQLRPGSVHTLEIIHDDDCRIFKGGVCGCRPDARLVAS